MLPETYLVQLQYDRESKERGYLTETKIGRSKASVIEDILRGEYDDHLRAVYRINDERIEDVSDDICVELIRLARNGDSLSWCAIQFLDYCGFSIRQAAE